METAVASDRIPLYVATSGGNQYFFNLERLTREGTDFGWHVRKCRETTEFSRTNHIDKEVGLIQWHYARTIVPMGEL